MASLSEQIDRLATNTRAIAATVQRIAPPDAPAVFTRAVLHTHLGDLIRDVDPSELGLFSLVKPPSNGTYNKDGHPTQDPEVRRVEFATATPLRRQAPRREEKQEIEPEVYAHAALKYIDQYEPIRPMPRAYDQIVSILNRLNAVRANINALNTSLEQAIPADKAPTMKARVEEEERRVKELQARIASLKKEGSSQIQKPGIRVRNERSESSKPKPAPKPPAAPPNPPSPSSPQEEKFWGPKGEPSRTLRFTENLLDEDVNIGDVSSASFGTPLAIPSQVPRLSLFASSNLGDEPTIREFPPSEQVGSMGNIEKSGTDRTPTPQPSSPGIPETPPPAQLVVEVTKTQPPLPTETPTTRQRKVKISLELEKIVAKIWATVSDVIIPPNRDSPTLSVPETIAYLQNLSEQIPAPDSPIASSASTTTAEGGGPPNAQQVQTAYLLTMLLSSPQYSIPLNQAKENLALKAKSSGIIGQGTTRVLFSCVAKRLVKIDRGGREQIVKFDI
ncbi:hypothetical protein BDN70DRAFT_825533 [Pholiota conissans]|uniref:Uncharacterized protein n=1 Tax=Pholiota conissans TaxID=109636 RepID=A0A9P5ZCM7_9AGAR|nr:hypothetical protein BDN70DRAFT_825533 [Pholiota conissans]